MANPFFKFKQFTVWHDKCAMKVGTDGVLLGAWADVINVDSVLDVGTGTGLIALMLAQRSSASIDAIDIDENAIRQAHDNVLHSPWNDRITVFDSDYKTFTFRKHYDLIVSNPPFFAHSLKSPDKTRTIARHTQEMDYPVLLSRSSEGLTPKGALAIIIPFDMEEEIIKTAHLFQLFPSKITRVLTKPDSLPKRSLVTFRKEPTKCLIDELLIEISRHIYSEDYIKLTRDFYLNM